MKHKNDVYIFLNISAGTLGDFRILSALHKGTMVGNV